MACWGACGHVCVSIYMYIWGGELTHSLNRCFLGLWGHTLEFHWQASMLPTVMASSSPLNWGHMQAWLWQAEGREGSDLAPATKSSCQQVVMCPQLEDIKWARVHKGTLKITECNRNLRLYYYCYRSKDVKAGALSTYQRLQTLSLSVHWWMDKEDVVLHTYIHTHRLAPTYVHIQ